MAKPLKQYLTLTIVAIVALAVGAGAVLAFGLSTPKVEPDSVVVLRSQGMTCGSCAGRIEAALKEGAGVAEVGVDVASGQVIVAYDSKVVKPETLAETVTAAGFGSNVLQNMSMEQFQALTGRNGSALAQARSGGCGGCCNRN